eukprot:2934901-Prymnesium_polylepis.1
MVGRLWRSKGERRTEQCCVGSAAGGRAGAGGDVGLVLDGRDHEPARRAQDAHSARAGKDCAGAAAAGDGADSSGRALRTVPRVHAPLGASVHLHGDRDQHLRAFEACLQKVEES